MKVLAIDPGNKESAWVYYDDGKVIGFLKESNESLLTRIALAEYNGAHLAIEMIASYGMPVGAEVFETCVWIGRFIEAFRLDFKSHSFVYRRDVKLHLCGQARAKDGNVRQALIDRYGGKELAIGKKASPGPLHGIKADCWQALAVAVTWSDSAKLDTRLTTPRGGGQL